MLRKYKDPPAVFKEAPKKIDEMLSYLNLPQSLENHKDLLAQAAKDNISHEEFLKRLLSTEVSAKFERQIAARVAQARFPYIKTIEQFDFSHPTQIPRAKIMAAMELGFIERNEGLVFIASHGLGKTHLAIAIAHKAALAGVRTLFTTAVDMVNRLTSAQENHNYKKAMGFYTNPALLVIDEVARFPVGLKDGEHFFHVIDARYERGSTILCSNRAFRDWGKMFQDDVCAKSIVDRIVHHSELIRIEGVSYRIKDRKTKSHTDEQ